MPVPKGWEISRNKNKKLKNYDAGDTVLSYSNSTSDLRDKATSEYIESITSESGLLFHELYGTEEQVEDFRRIDDENRIGFVPLIKIVKRQSDDGKVWYQSQLSVPFYDFSKYPSSDYGERWREIGQDTDFGKLKAITIGFMRLVPTFSLADAMVLDRRSDSPEKWLHEEQLKHKHIDEDWNTKKYDNANVQW